MDGPKVLGSEKISVIADCREVASNVTRHLRRMDVDVTEKQLLVGDYVASERICIERKTVSDFIGSMLNQRLFRQMEELSANYESPLVIMEGDPERLFLERSVHPNAIRGALSSIALDYRIPIIWTYSTMETANQIYWIAKREQNGKKTELPVRAEKRLCSIPAQQEFIISGLPHVSNVLSRRLLDEFGTIGAVFSAGKEDLMRIEGIGDKKAQKILDIINCKYAKKRG